jgi:hypothetical protein
MYDLRFWQKNINVCFLGKYTHSFKTLQNAWDFAFAVLSEAYAKGIDEIDINNDFYSILE